MDVVQLVLWRNGTATTTHEGNQDLAVSFIKHTHTFHCSHGNSRGWRSSWYRLLLAVPFKMTFRITKTLNNERVVDALSKRHFTVLFTTRQLNRKREHKRFSRDAVNLFILRTGTICAWVERSFSMTKFCRTIQRYSQINLETDSGSYLISAKLD